MSVWFDCFKKKPKYTYHPPTQAAMPDTVRLSHKKGPTMVSWDFDDPTDISHSLQNLEAMANKEDKKTLVHYKEIKPKST